MHAPLVLLQLVQLEGQGVLLLVEEVVLKLEDEKALVQDMLPMIEFDKMFVRFWY